jgi:hypothetical protein
MVGFVRRDIPSMSNESLIEKYTFNKKMMDVALAQGRADAIHDKKVKSYTYYSNNKNMIATELDRRIRDKEGVWCGGLDIYMTAEDAKQMLKFELEEKEKSIRWLNAVEAHAVIVNWDTDIGFLKAQLWKLLEDYPHHRLV